MKKIILLAIGVLSLCSGISQPDSANDTPHDAIHNHLYYLQPDSYVPSLAARSFTADHDSIAAIQFAVQLKQVFDGKGLFVRLNEIPDEASYLDSLTQQSSFTIFPDQLPEVYVVKSADGWHYSEQTVEAIPTLHKSVYPFGTDWLVNMVPKAGNKKLLGLYTWQFLGIVILLLITLVAFGVFNFVFKKALFSFKAISRTFLADKTKILHSVHYLLALWVAILLFSWLLPVLQLPVTTNETLSQILKIISSLIFLLLAFRIFDLVMSYIAQVTRSTESKMDDQLLPVIKRAGQFFIVTFWLLHLFTVLNVNITTLVAGISIGGLAIALAAQDTLKNLFGSITIFLDRPFQIGDWVKFSEGEGTVEEVGFRSTRIRSFANSLIYVPNSKLSDAKIDNFGLRQYRRYSTKIGITYDTPPDTIEAFVDGLRALVKGNKHIRQDSFEIHLNDLGTSALEILFYIFFDVSDWSLELKAKHELLMDILKLADRLGVKFAFPTQSIFIEGNAK